MSFVLGILMSLGACVGALIVWQSLPRDGVGQAARTRRQASGFQGRLTEWLYWDAPLTAPQVDDGDAPGGKRAARARRDSDRSDQVGDRALAAILGRIAAERQTTRKAAHDHLLAHVRSPAAKAFLQGKMRHAIRAHWRLRYEGPDALFLPWFYLIVTLRHGKRHLYLETLHGVLKELQRT